MMGTIQRQLRLRPGGDGEWTADAQPAWKIYWPTRKGTPPQPRRWLWRIRSHHPPVPHPIPIHHPPTLMTLPRQMLLQSSHLPRPSSRRRAWKRANGRRSFRGSSRHCTTPLPSLRRANTQQKEVIARLSQENAALRRQLQPENAVDVPMDESSASESSEPEMTSD